MIRYTMKCEEKHSFDSWFHSAAAFDKLNSAGLVACAICGSTDVKKAIMAPGVRPARRAAKGQTEKPADTPTPGPLSEPASPAEQAVREMRKKIEENSENVGREFAREARAIHDGEAPLRPIFGEAKPEEAKNLIEDGVPVAPLPWSSRKTN
jgi:hypothetical protein